MFIYINFITLPLTFFTNFRFLIAIQVAVYWTNSFILTAVFIKYTTINYSIPLFTDICFQFLAITNNAVMQSLHNQIKVIKCKRRRKVMADTAKPRERSASASQTRVFYTLPRPSGGHRLRSSLVLWRRSAGPEVLNQAPSVLPWTLVLIPSNAWTPTTICLTCPFPEVANNMKLINLLKPQDFSVGEWGTERLSNLPEVTQANGFKLRQCDSKVHTLNLCAQGLP